MSKIEPIGTIVSDNSFQAEIDQFLADVESDFGIKIPSVKQAKPQQIEPIYIQKRKPVERNEIPLF